MFLKVILFDVKPNVGRGDRLDIHITFDLNWNVQMDELWDVYYECVLIDISQAAALKSENVTHYWRFLETKVDLKEEDDKGEKSMDICALVFSLPFCKC